MYNQRRLRVELAKIKRDAGIISAHEYIYELWVAGLLVWDEAIELSVKETVKKWTGKHNK